VDIVIIVVMVMAIVTIIAVVAMLRRCQHDAPSMAERCSMSTRRWLSN
jgi:hypothetical protein